MNTLLKAACISIFAAICACASTIDITFTPPVLNVYPGNTDIAAYAVLQNTSTTDTVYLNSDNLTVPESSNVMDDFFTNVPISLAPSTSSGPIELFQFDVASDALPGSFTGTYQLLGGVGDANQGNLDLVGSQDFTVALAPVPEPAALLLAGGGLIVLAACLAFLRRKQVQRPMRASGPAVL